METIEYVEKLLLHYRDIQYRLNSMKHTAECYLGVINPKVMELLEMVIESGKPTCDEDDKEFDIIAAAYKGVMNSPEGKQIREMVKTYKCYRRELDRLDFCIRKLPRKLPALVIGMYFKKLTWLEIARRHRVSTSTVGRHKKQAISQIAKAFGVVDETIAEEILAVE